MYCAVWVEEGFCKETGNDVYCLFCCVFHVCVCVCLLCVLYYVSGGGVESPGDLRFVGSGFPQLNAREVGKWEGMDDTISLFADLVKENSTYVNIHHILRVSKLFYNLVGSHIRLSFESRNLLVSIFIVLSL